VSTEVLVRFDGKVVVVFGGAGGIGGATAGLFAARGAKIVVADINVASGDKVARSISDSGGEAIAIATDVARYDSVEAAITETLRRHNALDVVVNCAAIVTRRGLLEHEPDDFARVLRVNLEGSFNALLAGARAMRELGKRGCIINTASVAAYMATPMMIGYHASKGGVRSLTQAAALELAPFGIRVIAVAPAAVDTPLLGDVRSAGLERDLARKQLRRKLIAPEKVAEVVAFLASDEADAINGTVVLVDDGYVSFK
jgi:NAD(P)-dependent dehydrogenase (short-subunit alcohol dehydrogenase family)